MECDTIKDKLYKFTQELSDASFQEKTHIKSEDEINNIFLDAILDFKTELKVRSEKLNSISERFISLTWIEEEWNEECLKLLNSLIATARDLHFVKIREYVGFTSFRKKGIAKEEIKQFKDSIDNFKEAYSDVESVYFFLPNNSDFVEVTKRLFQN